MTGKPARQLRTGWTEAWERPEARAAADAAAGILYAPAAASLHPRAVEGALGFSGRPDRGPDEPGPAREGCRLRHRRRVDRHVAARDRAQLDAETSCSRRWTRRSGSSTRSPHCRSTPRPRATALDRSTTRRWGSTASGPASSSSTAAPRTRDGGTTSRRSCAGECCVVAIDLSGHGDSGRRDHYDMETWAAKSIAVAEHAVYAEPPIIVAHSMGGWVGSRLRPTTATSCSRA